MAEENKGKVFSSKDITEDKNIMQSYVDSGGRTDPGESLKNIAGSQKVSEDVRKMFIDEVTSVEKEIDPNRDDKKEAYDFFSPVIGRSIKSFKEKIEKGESIDEVTIKGKAKDVATKISKYAGDISSKPISDIVYNHIRLKDLENADSYEEVEKKIEDSGVGSMKDLMKFFLDSKDLADKPDPGIDSKLLNETLTKHNILLNGVAILLKELGIKNPAFEGAEKNFDDAIKAFNSKSLEGVNNESPTKASTEKAKEEPVISKTETKSLETLKNIDNTSSTGGMESASVATPQTTTPSISSQSDAKAPQVQTTPISIISEARPAENVAAPNKTSVNETPVVQSQPIGIKKEESEKNAPSSTGIEDVASKEPAPAKNYSPQELLLRSMGLGGLLDMAGNEDSEKYESSSTGTNPIEKSSPISMESIKPDVTKILGTSQGDAASISSPKMEKTSLKMTKEVQTSQKKETQNIESATEKPSTTQGEASSGDTTNVDETKSGSIVKNNETPASENTEEKDTKMDQKVLLSLLSVMQDVRDILSGPLIVTDSKNNFS